MKKLLIGFSLGILFSSAISFTAFTYKKTIMESWTGTLSPGERIIILDSKCTKVVVYPAISKKEDIKLDINESMKVTMMIQK